MAKLKSELEQHRSTLMRLENKWNATFVIQRLSSKDQARVFKAAASAKTIGTTIIPKLKKRIDAWMKNNKDYRLLHDIQSEWERLQPKVIWTLEEFEKLESGGGKFPKQQSTNKDEIMSLNIEKSLKTKREASKVKNFDSVKPNFGNLERDKDEHSKPHSKNTLLKNSRRRTCGGDAQKKLWEAMEGLSKLSPEALEMLEQMPKTSAIQSTTTANSRRRRSLAVIGRPNQLYDVEEETDMGDTKQSRRLRPELSSKPSSNAKLPLPIPIDSFLNFIESLPGDMQEMVKEETEALNVLKKDRPFYKEGLSDRKGTLVSMNKLKGPAFQDSRFDASDFFLEAPEHLIEEDHLKWMKSQNIDNAIERCFGSFKRCVEAECLEIPSTSKCCIQDEPKLENLTGKLPNLQ